MKIVITSRGETLDAPVDPQFGRAPRLLLHDTETGAVRVVENTQNMNAPQGAGIQTAQTVARLGAGCVITGHCGPKAFRALAAAGVAVVTGASGPAREAVEAYRAGRLKPAASADVEGHWA